MYWRLCREHYRQCDRSNQCIGDDVENTTGSVTELVSVFGDDVENTTDSVTELVSVFGEDVENTTGSVTELVSVLEMM